MLTRRTLLLGAVAAASARRPRSDRLRPFPFLDPDGPGARSFCARHGATFRDEDWNRAIPLLAQAEWFYQHRFEEGIPPRVAAQMDRGWAALPAGPLREWMRAETAAMRADRDAGLAQAVEILRPFDEAFLTWRSAWFETGRMRLRLEGEPDLAAHGRRHPSCARAALPHARAAARRFLAAALGGLPEAWPRFLAYAAQIRSFGACL